MSLPCRKQPLTLRRSRRHIPEGFYFLLEGKPHPLLIPGIVADITSYLCLSDLKIFRQVCQLWNTEAFKRIRELSKIIIQDEDRLIQFTKSYQSLQPHQKCFFHYELRGDIDLGSDSVIKFFKVFGESITLLHFNKVRWRDASLKNIIFNLLPNLRILGLEARAYSDRRLFESDNDFDKLPNIKELRLNVFSFITELTTPFLRDILRACPNLEKISSIKNDKRNPLPMQFIQYVCQEMSYDTADDVVNMPYAADIAIAEALIDVKDVKLPKLKILDCNMRLRAHGLLELGSKGFPIKELDLTLLADVSSDMAKSVLSQLEPTLRIVKLKYHPRCEARNKDSIPGLKNLTSLVLNGYRYNLKFLESLPNLKTLVLMSLNFELALLESGNINLKEESKVEDFELHEDFSWSCKADTVRTIISLFPTLKRLRLENLRDCGLIQVFKAYKNSLREFDAMHGQYTDEGVAGTYLEGGEKRGPYIGDLKLLRSLRMASPNLTDIGVREGVLHCSSLRRLQLISSHLTDTSISNIVLNLDLFYLKIQFCYKVSEKVINYAKDKMKGRLVLINEYEGPLRQSEIPKFMRRNGGLCVALEKMEFPHQNSIMASQPPENKPKI